jgi:hypothetical protein
MYDVHNCYMCEHGHERLGTHFYGHDTKTKRSSLYKALLQWKVRIYLPQLIRVK